MDIGCILVDSREPAWVKQLQFGGALVAESVLDAGDLLVGTDDALLCIERKTTDDFLASLRDDRLWLQLARMRKLTPWCYLVMCGALHPGPAGLTYSNDRSTGWNWSSVAGAFLTVQECGVAVVWCAGDPDYEAAVLRLAHRDRGPLRVRPARDLLVLTEAEQILTSLPGIGPERAKALLAYCGTAAWSLAYLSSDWDGPNPIDGIGPGTKQSVRRAIGLKDGTYLWLLTDYDDHPVLFERAPDVEMEATKHE